jgi:predicted secreted protein
MNKLSTLIATTLLIAAGAASAQTAPLTREAVIADLVAARNSGELAAIQGEKGIEVTTPATAKAAAVATTKLPRQAVLTVKPTELRVETTAALAADHGENAARELGDFPAPVVRRASSLASR